MRVRARPVDLLPLLLVLGGVGYRATRELLLHVQVRDAACAAVLHIPSPVVWVPIAGATVALGIVGVLAVLRGLDARWVRAGVVFGFLALTADLFLIPTSAPVIRADLLTETVLRTTAAKLAPDDATGALPA